MNINKILINPNDIGTLWCTGVHPVYEYVDGRPTENLIGYRYSIVAIDMDAESFNVKIPGNQKIDVTSGHKVVKLVDPQWIVYKLDRRPIQVSCKATDIKVVQD